MGEYEQKMEQLSLSKETYTKNLSDLKRRAISERPVLPSSAPELTYGKSILGGARPSEEDPILAWLKSLDQDRGAMLRYLEPIKGEFETLDTLRLAVMPQTEQ